MLRKRKAGFRIATCVGRIRQYGQKYEGHMNAT